MFPARLYPDFPRYYLSRTPSRLELLQAALASQAVQLAAIQTAANVAASNAAAAAASASGLSVAINSVATAVAALGTQPITIVSPVSGSNPPSLVLCRGDDYNVTTAQQVVFSIPLAPALSGNVSSVMLYVRTSSADRCQTTRFSRLLSQALDLTSGITITGTAQLLAFSVTHAQTGNLPIDPTGMKAFYEVVATFTDASVRTLVTGPCIVTGSVTW